MRERIPNKLDGKTRKDFEVNVLKTERGLIEQRYVTQETDVTDKQLVNNHHKAMLKIYDASKEIGHTPSKFRRMVANEGGTNRLKS